MNFIISVFAVLAVFHGNAQSVQGCDSIPSLNIQIVKAVKMNIGKQVGTGECWDLIQVVLDQVNAKWERTEKFGIVIQEKSACLSPGDIIKFYKAFFEGTVSDGSSYTASMYHHYAIIILVKGDELVIAHQNTADYGRKVGLSTIKLSDLKKGKLTFFRPQTK